MSERPDDRPDDRGGIAARLTSGLGVYLGCFAADEPIPVVNGVALLLIDYAVAVSTADALSTATGFRATEVVTSGLFVGCVLLTALLLGWFFGGHERRLRGGAG